MTWYGIWIYLIPNCGIGMIFNIIKHSAN